MKKFLSLVLALAMAMSLVVVNTSAKEFTDDEDITYDEAVAVISEIGVVDGYTDGNFNPTNGLTRGAAAKIICNLILGPTTAAELHADTAPYSDVSINNEFAGYIAYCAKEGIISGYADGAFRPANPLTGYAFMKMLLGALGYDANYEQYVGNNWSVNVAKQAIGIGLNKGLVEEFNGVDYVTREEAALYAFNTLKATMVDYENKITANVNGAEVTISNTSAKPVTWSEGINEDGNIKLDGFVQFAEEYFPKLVRNDDSDDFMRPANNWVYDKIDIGTYARYDLLVESYTTEVTGKDVYDLLKSGVIKDNDLESYVDGKANTIKESDLVRSNNDKLANTGDGVVTEVYLDTDKELITIVSVNTYLAKATADYNESKEYAPLNVYISDANGRNYNVDVEQVENVVDVKEDTFYQVNVSYKDNASVGEVKILNTVEVLEDSTVTKFSTNGTLVTKLTTGGEEYKKNVKAFYDDDILDEYDASLLTDATYNVYVDANGYFLGVDLFEGTKNYVFITGYDLSGSNIAVKTAEAAGIFLDGTMSNIKVNIKETNDNIAAASGYNAGYFDEWNKTNADSEINEWYTYTVDANGNYTLKPAVRMTWTKYNAGTDVVVRTDNLSIKDTEGNKDRVYGEDATVFLTVDTDDVSDSTFRGITDVEGVYTGVQNVDIEIDTNTADALRMGQIFTVYDSDYYVIGAVVIGEAIGGNQNLAYILGNVKSEEYRDGEYYWEFEAVLNGEIQTFTARSKYPSTTVLKPGTVQELRFDGDYVINIKSLDADDLYLNNTQPIDGESVYQMIGLTRGTTTLNLQGRTFYLTALRTDVGLALAADAKAVVIQDENSKIDVKTEFSSVGAAIAHLADPDNNTANGTQYDGNIYAILDSNGVAQWMVFDSSNRLMTGGNVPPTTPTDYTPVVTQRGTFLDVQAHTTNGTDSVVYTGAWNWLVNNGYNVVNVTNNGTSYTFIATKNGNTTFFTTNLIPMVQLYVNGVERYVRSDGTLDYADVLTGPYYATGSTEITTVGLTTVSDLSATGSTTWNTSNFTANDGLHIKDGLYPVTVGTTTLYYQIGETIALKGSTYSTTDGTVTNATIPSGGLKMSTALSGKTINATWKVTVAGETAPVYVTDGGNTSTLTKLTGNSWYRTDDGKFVQATSGQLNGVTSDVTISTVTSYVKVSTPNEQTSANKIGSSAGLYTYTITTTGVKEGSAAVYLKANDTITVSVTYVSGTVASDTINVGCTATTVSGTGSVNFTSTDPVGTTKTVTVKLTATTTDGALSIS